MASPTPTLIVIRRLHHLQVAIERKDGEWERGGGVDRINTPLKTSACLIGTSARSSSTSTRDNKPIITKLKNLN